MEKFFEVFIAAVKVVVAVGGAVIVVTELVTGGSNS
jgi:hypothetical protein